MLKIHFGYHRKLLKMLFLSILFILFPLLCAMEVQAENIYYVRAGASGANNGSDWNNAFTSLPSTLQRGAIYLVADGNYPEYNFNTAESGTSLITIRKATPAAHGTSIGWKPSYGDGQAQFGPINLTRGYIIFDGVTGGGPDSWKTGHGFKIFANYVSLLTLSGAISKITISHIEFAFPTSEVDDSLAADHIFGISSVKDFTLEYSYLHDTSRVFILSRGWTDVLIQYNYFARNRSTAGRHAEGWSDHNGTRYIIRNNIWEDIEGTGIVVMLYGSAYDWEIYGNVVTWSGNPNYGGIGNGSFTTRSAEANAYNWKIYNNTVVNGLGNNTFHYIYNGNNNAIKNNLWYNSPAFSGGAASIDYNWYIKSGSRALGSNDIINITGADPFVDIENGDFRLRAASPAGIDLTTAGKQFHLDPNMAIRGEDGVWDRGAFEFGSFINPPNNLRIISP